MKDSRVRVARQHPDGTPGFYFFVEVPVALTDKQLHRVKLGALKAWTDQLRAMPAAWAEKRAQWKAVILALQASSIESRVVGQNGASNGEIVLFEAPNKPGRQVFSFGPDVLRAGLGL